MCPLYKDSIVVHQIIKEYRYDSKNETKYQNLEVASDW